MLVMNLTACDFISCLIHPMAVYSAYRGRWSFGKTGKPINKLLLHFYIYTYTRVYYKLLFWGRENAQSQKYRLNIFTEKKNLNFYILMAYRS